MRVERLANTLGGIAIQIVADGPEMAAFGEAAVKAMVEKVAHQLSCEFLSLHGNELVAKVNLDAVLNRAVAETVLKIAAAESAVKK